MAKAVKAVGTAIMIVGAVVATGGMALAMGAGVGLLGSASLATSAVLSVGSFSVSAGALLSVGSLVSSIGGSLAQPKVSSAGGALGWVGDPNGPLHFAAGRIAVGGDLRHKAAYGPNDRMYFSAVTVVSDAGPIDAFESFTANDIPVTFDASGKANSSYYANVMWRRTQLGFQPEGSYLASPSGLQGGASLPNWGASHKLSGKAAFILTLSENSKQSAYKGQYPKPRTIIRGLRVYDWRRDSTYPGGAGPQRLNEPSTWAYSANPILWSVKWLLGLWEGPTGKGAPQVDYQVGGIGTRWENIDIAAFTEAANIADTHGWTCAAWPSTDDDKAQVLDAFLQAGGAYYIERAGKASCIHRAAPRVSVATITAADTAGPIELDTSASYLDRKNTGVATYLSEADGWKMTALPEVSSSQWVTEDGGRKRSVPVTYSYVDKAKQAAELICLGLAHTREGISGRIPLKSYMQGIGPGSAFTITEPEFVLDGLKCLCLETSYDANTGVHTVTFVSETDAKYPYAFGQTPNPPPPPALTPVDPTHVSPPLPGDWTITPRPPAPGGGQLPGFDLGGIVSNETATAILVEYGPTATGPWKQAYQGPPTVTTIPIDGLQPGATYYIAVRYQRDQNYSDRYVYGPYTAPNLEPSHLGSEPVQDTLDKLTNTATLADQNRRAVEALEEVYGDTASAAQSAAAAAASEAAAAQAKADAVIAAGQAQGAASDAAADALVAAQKAGEALGSANSAAGSAAVASTKADEAGTAAVASLASSVTATTAAGAAIGTIRDSGVIPPFTSKSNIQRYWSHQFTGASETLADLLDANIENVAEGWALKINASTDFLRPKWALTPVAGQKVRVTVKCRKPSTAANSLQIITRGQSAAGAAIGANVTTSVVLTGTDSQTVSAVMDMDAWVVQGAASVMFRLSSSGAGVIYVTAVQIEDATAQVASEAAATASSSSAASAAASETAAGQAASAADTSRQQAQTARAGAEAAQSSAADSATTATGAAATATQQAGLATTAKNASEAAAQASVNARNQAASFADDAEVSAGASSVASVTAVAARQAAEAAQGASEDARDQSQSAATASAASASSAAASETAAGQSASAANTAKTQAETARGQAQTAATNAASSRDDAAGSAASASASAVQSANSRDAAAGSASAAAGSASTATTKAGEAGTSAAAAMASQVSASTAAGAAQGAAIGAIPDLISTTLWSNNATTGEPTNRPNLTSAAVVGATYRPGIGSDAAAGPKGLIPWVDGKIVEVTAVISSPAVEARARVGLEFRDATYARPAGPSASPLNLIAAGAKTTISRRFGLGVAVAGGTQVAKGSTEWVGFYVQMNLNASGASEPGANQICSSLIIRDITAQVAAELSASASATSASSAAASEAAAGQSANAASGSAATAATRAGEASSFSTLAAGSASAAAGSAATASQASGTSVAARDAAIGARNDAQAAAATALTQSSNASASAANAQISANLAAQVGGHGRRISDGSLFTASLGGSPASVADLTVGTVVQDASEGASRSYTEAVNIQTKAVYEIGSGRTFRVYSRARVMTNGADNTTFAHFRVLDASYANLGPVGSSFAQGAADGWKTFVHEMTSEQIKAAFPTAFYIRGAVRMNRAGTTTGSSGATTRVAELWLEDLSELAPVAAQASLALSTSVDALSRLGQAAFELILASGGNPAYIKGLAGPGGSELAFAATELLLRNVVGDQIVTALKLINGEAYFGAPVSVTIGGRRLTIGPGFGVSNGVILWFGPSTTAIASMSRTNGYFALGTDGKVYYGNAELGGGGVLTATASSLIVQGGRNGAGGVSTSTTTVTAAGGNSGASIRWVKVSGDDLVANSPSSFTTSFYGTVGTGQSKSAVFMGVVTKAGQQAAVYVQADIADNGT
jgi:hypothetical protein